MTSISGGDVSDDEDGGANSSDTVGMWVHEVMKSENMEGLETRDLPPPVGANPLYEHLRKMHRQEIDGSAGIEVSDIEDDEIDGRDIEEHRKTLVSVLVEKWYSHMDQAVAAARAIGELWRFDKSVALIGDAHVTIPKIKWIILILMESGNHGISAYMCAAAYPPEQRTRFLRAAVLRCKATRGGTPPWAHHFVALYDHLMELEANEQQDDDASMSSFGWGQQGSPVPALTDTWGDTKNLVVAAIILDRIDSSRTNVSARLVADWIEGDPPENVAIAARAMDGHSPSLALCAPDVRSKLMEIKNGELSVNAVAELENAPKGVLEARSYYTRVVPKALAIADAADRLVYNQGFAGADK
jgi:hypothetical protein